MASVLVIEDDPDYRILLKDALESAGFDVMTAVNGSDGVDTMARGACAVVITDMLMPEKEGFETILELKRLKTDVQIVAISGGGRSGRGEDLLRHAKVFGAHYTMAKPIVLKDLVALVRGLMPA